MAMTRAQWEALQARLPKEDRTSYEDYLASLGTNVAMNMASERYTAAAQAAGLTPTTTRGTSRISPASIGIDPQDIRDPITGLTPAQVAAQNALAEAVAAGKALGIETVTNSATAGNVPTVTVTKVPTGPTGPIPTFATAPVPTTATAPTIDPAIAALLEQLRQQNAAAQLAAQQAAAAKAAQDKAARQSAFDLLFQQFSQYGLGGLVEPLRGLIESGVSPSEFTIKLRETDAYKKRFAANQARIQKGLRALSEAEYIGLEDQYQDVMRRYGLPDTYYTRGDMGRQEGFEKFIGGDVSPVELEDRIQTAQRRVINAAPEITASLRSFYPEIGQGDLLAYFLDPDKAIENIKRKVTAAEIGGAATMAGLATGMARAEELGRYGVTGEAARQGFQTIAGVLPRGSQLAEIYKQSPYTQTTAEQEVFGLAGAAEAGRQRRKLTELETAAFSGQAGAAGGALARDRAGAF